LATEKFYNELDASILAEGLEKAFNSVGCDLRCFDWLSYRPDYWIKKEEENGKKAGNCTENT